jgi:hypothetical protein
LAQRFKVRGYPSLKLIENDLVYAYRGRGRTLELLDAFVTNPSASSDATGFPSKDAATTADVAENTVYVVGVLFVLNGFYYYFSFVFLMTFFFFEICSIFTLFVFLCSVPKASVSRNSDPDAHKANTATKDAGAPAKVLKDGDVC